MNRSAYTGSRPDVRRFISDDMSRILDVGCSNGAIGKALKEEINRYVVGLEGNEAYADQARDVLDKVITCDLDRFDIESLRDEDGFDCIIFADVLEHIINPVELFRVLVSTCLCQDGVVVISLPNACHVLTFIALLRKEWPYRDVGLFDSTHMRWFCWKNIEHLGAMANMDILEVGRNYRIFYNWKDKRNRFVRYLMWNPIKDYITYQYVVLMGRRDVAKIVRAAQ